MTANNTTASVTRRALLEMVGATAGTSLLYGAMTTLGFADESPWRRPLDLQGAAKDTSVLILGAGLAGMTAAFELRNAGYRVQVLEYNSRAGGRCWTLRGGDSYTELGGERQTCQFDNGGYFDPGPWRIPHTHRAVLYYCRRLGVAMQPFIPTNSNAYLHNSTAFGGRPRRFREIRADYQGHVAELLAKTVRANALDAPLEREDLERLIESLRIWGALDENFSFTRGAATSRRRGYEKAPGGGLGARPVFSTPESLIDVLRSGLWRYTQKNSEELDMQAAMLQPVGGMGRIGDAFARELGPLIRYNSRVIDVRQGSDGVTVRYEDPTQEGARFTTRAQWCLCTIPLSILSQIPINVSAPMSAAIGAVSYSASAKVGLQFRRRFWEQDEQIYGGATFTDLPIGLISYPSHELNTDGKGVLLGAYTFGRKAMAMTGLPPADRVRQAVEFGSRIHPQYRREFENGVSVAWHRVPGTLGCFAEWNEQARARHYDALCAIDGRIALAGEHVSYLPGWQEGAVTSALDAVHRMHQRAVQTSEAA